MKNAERYRLLAFWVLASAFAWGLAVAPYIRRVIRDLIISTFRALSTPFGNYAYLYVWTTLLTYPALCWTAALLLKRTTRKGSGVLVAVHVTAGFVWMVFFIYVFFLWGSADKR